MQRARAYADLEKAEPALLAAKTAVKQIKRNHLDEVKALAKYCSFGIIFSNIHSPPPLVRMTMECVVLITTGKKADWAAIRRILTDMAFIPNVVNFDTKKLSEFITVFVR